MLPEAAQAVGNHEIHERHEIQRVEFRVLRVFRGYQIAAKLKLEPGNNWLSSKSQVNTGVRL